LRANEPEKPRQRIVILGLLVGLIFLPGRSDPYRLYFHGKTA
jgi:hypothetical protein